MFAAMPVPIFQDFLPAHYPSVSSPLSSSPIRASSPPAPLSPRDHNAFSARRQIQSSPIKPSSSLSSNDKLFRFASRASRPNPVVRNREGFQQARRNLFLKGVQQRSDDQRWERRGVESKLLSAEWFNMDQARRQAKSLDGDGMITEADIADAERLMEEEMRAAQLPRRHDRELDETMVDALLQEEAELEVLIASSASQPQSSNQIRPDSHGWSDDDEYDALFMDIISGQENQISVSSGDMDMS